MNQYRIKYKIDYGYYVQYRDWKTCWTWINVGYEKDNNFYVSFYSTLQEAQKKVKQLSWEKTQERTVYLYKG